MDSITTELLHVIIITT